MNASTLAAGASLSFLYPWLAALASAWRAAGRAWSMARLRQQQLNRERQALIDLHEMSERELADLGLARCDLPRLAWHKADRFRDQDLATWQRLELGSRLSPHGRREG